MNKPDVPDVTGAVKKTPEEPGTVKFKEALENSGSVTNSPSVSEDKIRSY